MASVNRALVIAVAATLMCAAAAFLVACQEKPSYQAVVVGENLAENDLYVVQMNEAGERSSGLIVLHLPEKTSVDPSTLVQGDVVNVYGSEQIALSFPGQAHCTNLRLAKHIEGEAFQPYLEEWEYFEEHLVH